MLRGVREILAVRSPLDAELMVSELLGTWWGQQLPDADVEEVVGEGLVDHAARSGTAAALALLTGMAYLGTPGQAEKAARAVRELTERGVRRPPWAERLGRVAPGDCWVSRDAYGDQDSVICAFSYEGPRGGAQGGDEPHALVVLVDYNLGGMVKDAWLTSQVDKLLDHCRQEARENPLMGFEAMDPARARALLESALEETDLAVDPPVSEGLASYHALVRARLRALPAGGTLPEPAEFAEDERAALAAAFLASPEAEHLSDTAAAGRCADHIVDHGCDYDLGRPLRVSPIKAELFLLDWLPRKVMLTAEDQEAMPHVLAAWVRWAARRSGLPKAGVAETLDAVWEAAGKFEETYGDPTALGLDPDAVDRLLPDGDLEALPRRAFAVPLPVGTYDDIDLSALNPADADDRHLLIAAEHPDYDDAIKAAGTGDVEVDGVNPRLHLTLHEAVANQLWDGEPPETWETAQRLLDLGYERHDVLHMLMSVVGESLRQSMVDERPFDVESFRNGLEALPESWEDLRPE